MASATGPEKCFGPSIPAHQKDAGIAAGDLQAKKVPARL
jgi:hypothetical protein